VLYNLSPPQGTTLDPPSHLLPAEHSAHDVLVVVSPPMVLDPERQVRHLAAPLVAAYSLSLPHAEHVVPSPNFPGGQSTIVEEPSQLVPTAHTAQVVRAAGELPEVALPAGQVAHLSAPAAL